MSEFFAGVVPWFYDVFVAQWDAWLILGFVAQAMFMMRFIIQWIASERAGQSIVPVAFWYFSLAGGILLFVYALYRRDPVFIAGQGAGVFIYLRNLRLIMKHQKKLADEAAEAAQVGDKDITKRDS